MFSIVLVVKVTWDILQICSYLLKSTPIINCKMSAFFLKGNHFITAGAQHVIANNSQLSQWWRGTARNLVLVKQEQYCFPSPEINDKRSQISKTITLWVVTEEGLFVGESRLRCDTCFYQSQDYSGINVGHVCNQFETINWTQISKYKCQL